MTISVNTKIAQILKQHPAALEAIISISPKFNKLRNPLLRKIMASRTTIAMASKVAGCTASDFFEKLEPLGFAIDDKTEASKIETTNQLPAFINSLDEKKVVELDVRPIIAADKDPFKEITGTIKQLDPGAVLKLINSFEPTPLIALLSKQGFQYFVETVHEDLVITYFLKPEKTADAAAPAENNDGDWETIIKKFENKLVTIDVRQMEMPKPMMTILEALDVLADDQALYVYHKRIPVFLLPELQERKFDYRIKKIGDGEVYLLIFKP